MRKSYLYFCILLGIIQCLSALPIKNQNRNSQISLSSNFEYSKRSENFNDKQNTFDSTTFWNTKNSVSQKALNKLSAQKDSIKEVYNKQDQTSDENMFLQSEKMNMNETNALGSHFADKNEMKKPFFSFFELTSAALMRDDSGNQTEVNQTAIEEQKKLEEARKKEEERQKKIRQNLQDLEDYKIFAITLTQKLNAFILQMKSLEDQMHLDLHKNLQELMLQLKNSIEAEYKSTLKVIEKDGDKIRQYIEQKKQEIRKDIEIVILQSNISLCETRELKIIMFQFEVGEKQRIIDESQEKIDILQPKLPPPKSICNLYLECGTCTANPMCGWCASKDKCIDGDEIGPSNEVCAVYNYRICTGFDCGSHTECKSCLEDPICGWCENPPTGRELCLQRDPNYSGCPAASWYHSAGSQKECSVVAANSAEGLKKGEDDKEWENKKVTRKEEVNKANESLSEEDKLIETQQEEIISCKQQILAANRAIKDLKEEIAKVEEEIKHCERDRRLLEDKSKSHSIQF